MAHKTTAFYKHFFQFIRVFSDSRILFGFCMVMFVYFMTGCDAQKSFTPAPERLKGQIIFNGKLEKSIATTNAQSAKLKNNRLLTKNALNTITLRDNEVLLSQSEDKWLIADGCRSLRIIPLKERDMQFELNRKNTYNIVTQGCVVAASMKNNLVAGVLGDNTMFLYDLTQEKFTFQEKGESIYAVSSLSASPAILDTLVIFPTLDGRLNTVDIAQAKSVKNIIVNTEKFLNNIIFLDVDKDELVSATQKRLYTLIRGESYAKDIEIKDIYLDGGYIYILSLNGIIYQLDKTLAVIKSVKLPYANLNGILIKDGHLYTFDNSSSYLIDLMIENFEYEVFKVKFGAQRWFSKRITLFYTHDILYINNRILDFNREITKKMK